MLGTDNSYSPFQTPRSLPWLITLAPRYCQVCVQVGDNYYSRHTTGWHKYQLIDASVTLIIVCGIRYLCAPMGVSRPDPYVCVQLRYPHSTHTLERRRIKTAFDRQIPREEQPQFGSSSTYLSFTPLHSSSHFSTHTPQASNLCVGTAESKSKDESEERLSFGHTI